MNVKFTNRKHNKVGFWKPKMGALANKRAVDRSSER
jgi:hypothetical protein